QALERIQRGEIAIVDAEHVAVRDDRVWRIAQHLFVERGDPVQQHEAYARVVGEVGAARDDLDELVDAAIEGEQASERGEREQIVGARLVDLAPRGDRARVVAALTLVDVRGTRIQRRGEIAVRRRRRARLELVRGLVPRLELRGQREQLRERR